MLVQILLFGLSRLQLLSGGVVDDSLLGFAFSSWEQNQFALVLFKALDVGLEGFL